MHKQHVCTGDSYIPNKHEMHKQHIPFALGIQVTIYATNWNPTGCPFICPFPHAPIVGSHLLHSTPQK